MEITNEAGVKKVVKEIFKKYGIYYFMPATHGYGKSGVPDFVACINGRFLAIETKYKKNIPTILQQRELQLIKSSGGVTMVVNEETIEAFRQLIMNVYECL